MDFAIQADLREITKKRGKDLNLGRELKHIWNMKLTLIPIVIDALGTVYKGLITGMEKLAIEGRAESIKNTAYGGARGVKVIVAGNGHSDTSSNP